MSPPAGGSITNTAGSFAYQAILGAAVPISSVPGLAISAEYRFMGLSGNRTYGSGRSSVVLTDDYNHAVLLGIRYAFGAPAPAMVAAPAPAPAPAVVPARSYLVFFDWDKATLTDRARQIIKEAADNSTHVQYTRIEVNGYTDTSGTPQYNMGLSIRRANAVKAELIKDGVPLARSPPKASARRICWSRPGRACASRRTGAWRSSSANGRPSPNHEIGAPRGAPMRSCPCHAARPRHLRPCCIPTVRMCPATFGGMTRRHVCFEY